MYGALAILEMGFSLTLFLLSWIAVRQAQQLRRSGTSARLHRKSRKLLQTTCWLTVSAMFVFIAIGWMVASLPALFWEDRLTLNVPLIVAPLLAIWFTTVPMIWQIWKQSDRPSRVLSNHTKKQLHSRLYILPFQSTALGAITSFYCTLISPIPYDKLKVTAPLTVYLVIMVALWLHHDGRLHAIRDWLRAKRHEEHIEEDSSKQQTRA